jgi:hypothetical protein
VSQPTQRCLRLAIEHLVELGASDASDSSSVVKQLAGGLLQASVLADVQSPGRSAAATSALSGKTFGESCHDSDGDRRRETSYYAILRCHAAYDGMVVREEFRMLRSKAKAL